MKAMFPWKDNFIEFWQHDELFRRDAITSQSFFFSIFFYILYTRSEQNVRALEL